MSESSFVRKEPCPACGSRDNLARYSDGHAHCFGCGCYERADGSAPDNLSTRRPRMADFVSGDVQSLGKRKINEETARKFSYRVGEFKGQTVQIADYFNPEGTQVVAQKVRFPNKDFTITGNMKEAGLYGQHLWRDAGKMVVVTEGEIDALTVSQLQGNKWPVVSVNNGAGAAKKALSRQLQWLEGFDTVVLFFDNDEQGMAAVEECAPLFKPGKVKVARMAAFKDASEAHMAGQSGQVIDAIWGAKAYRPDGLVRVSDIKAQALKDPEEGLPWCFEALTKLTYGRRWGEIYALGAGTGVGKTDLLTQQIQHDLVHLMEKVAVFFLETPTDEVLKRVAGKMCRKTFHINDGSWEMSELAGVLDQMEEEDNLILYDNFGATDWEIIKTHIRFLAHAEGVRLFYLDHLTALAAAEEDERKALERIMAEMASLCKELGVIIHLVSHLATPEGKPHEEGGRVMIRHFKGSRAIGFWCHFMFGLERDQQNENPEVKTTTIFRVLKDRHSGRSTGSYFYLGYDQKEGRLYEREEPKGSSSHGFEDETGSMF